MLMRLHSILQATTHATINNVGQMSRVTSATMQQASQHKRSLSFNHHLSYNQYSSPNSSNAATLNHKQMNDPSLHQHIQLREKPDQPVLAAKTNSKGEPSAFNSTDMSFYFILYSRFTDTSIYVS